MRVPLVLALSLSGCTLIDQNTFNPQAGAVPVIAAPPAVAVAPVLPGPPPLVVIGAADPAEYGDALRKAVAAARARKPDVMFDVVEVQPATAAGDAAIGARAAGVARVIVAEGVAPGRVRLVARPDAGATVQVVRVYVR